MKKVLSIFICFLSFSAFSQEQSKMIDPLNDFGIKQSYEKHLNKNLSLSSGDYLQKSSNHFMASLCFSMASVCVFYGGSCIDKKDSRNIVYGIGAAIGIVSIYQGIRGVVYLNRAGKKLNLEQKDRESKEKNVVYIEPVNDGIGLKFTF